LNTTLGSEIMMYKKGKLRGDKVKFNDTTSCCVWYPMSEDAVDAGLGICFDFDPEDIPDMIELLEILQDAEPEVLEEMGDE